MLILAILCGVQTLVLLAIAVMWPRVEVLEDNVPVVNTPKNRVMKLQNELMRYTYTEDGKAKIKVVKR